MKLPKIGDKIYIPSAYYIGHGEDDHVGGLATIVSVTVNEKLPDDHYNKIFVNTIEVPRAGYNYKYLLEKQEELKEKFGEQKAYPDPDYNDYGERW